jgi:hypothetical protein
MASLYGDGAITPAISVLSAVESVGFAIPSFEHVHLIENTLLLFLCMPPSEPTFDRTGWEFLQSPKPIFQPSEMLSVPSFSLCLSTLIVG